MSAFEGNADILKAGQFYKCTTRRPSPTREGWVPMIAEEQAAMTVSITLEGQIAKLEDLLNQAKALKQIAAGVSAIDKQNELMGLKIQRLESKRVDDVANMSDDELRRYVYQNKELYA